MEWRGLSKYLLNISGQETGVLLVVIAEGICVNKDFIEKCLEYIWKNAD